MVVSSRFDNKFSGGSRTINTYPGGTQEHRKRSVGWRAPIR